MDKKTKKKSAEDEKLPLPPQYDEKDDIYSHEKNVGIEEEPAEDMGLDVPGAELDDADEATGSEDEENNYYSLGGDNHDDLEEDHDELEEGKK
jgi:hypothetical protein